MTFVSGIIAAVLSPFVTTIGFLIWEYTWSSSSYNHHRSAFALNLYKCCLASILFYITIMIILVSTTSQQQEDPTVSEDGNRYLISLWSSLLSSTNNHMYTKQQVIGYLLLSSTIGIVIGDILWLQALTILGSVQVIFIDALKPFVATLFGTLLFNEPFHYTILLGIVITTIGIVVISIELSKKTIHTSNECDTNMNDNNNPIESITINNNNKLNEPDTTISSAPTSRNNNKVRCIGYTLSFVNVLLDTYGSVLTKKYGVQLTAFEINLIRFGFAGAVLLCISITMILFKIIQLNILPSIVICNKKGSNVSEVITMYNKSTLDIETDMTTSSFKAMASSIPEINEAIPPVTLSANVVSIDDSVPTTTSEVVLQNALDDPTKEEKSNETPWYALPIHDPTMTKWMWMYVSIGVIFVTYIAPTLSNYSLFEISLALSLTLTSVGPLYALPMSYIVQRYFYHHQKQAQNSTRSDDTDINTIVQPPKRPTLLAWIGAFLTILGIAILSYTGN